MIVLYSKTRCQDVGAGITRGVHAVALVGFVLLGFCSVASAEFAFDDRTAEAGPFHVGESWGASWGHLDADVYPDLYVSNHKALDSIYRNNGDGTFTDVTETVDVDRVWLDDPERDTHGAAWGDFDNDGDQDLLAITGGSNNPNQFMVNENGSLFDRTLEYQVPTVGSGRMAAWFDYDADGWLDALISSRGGGAKLLQGGGLFFVDNTQQSGVDCTNSGYAMLIDVKLTDDIADDGRMELVCAWQKAFPVNAYQIPTFPAPGFPFDDITAEFGSELPSATRNKDNAVADFNGDLRPDIFVVRGGMRPSDAAQVDSNALEAHVQSPGQQSVTFQTSGVVTFNISSNPNGITPSNIFVGAGGWQPMGMQFSVDPAIVDASGILPHAPNADLGLYISFDDATEQWRVEHSSGGKFAVTYLSARSTTALSNVAIEGLSARDVAQRPNLLMSVPGSIPAAYTEVAQSVGFGDALPCVSAAAGDFDNDMDVDLYVVCRGGVENLPNRLFENLGAGTFSEVPGAAGAQGAVGFNLAEGKGTGENVVVADYDVDGNLDLFVTNGLNLQPRDSGGPNQLFGNLGNGNHWVELDLVGSLSNRDAVGARVYATAGGITQFRAQDGGYHRWSQHHQRIHFALGPNTRLDLHVDWPSGNSDDFVNVSANRLWRVIEGATSGAGRIEEVDVAGNENSACGQPDYDRATEQGVFVWKDCSFGGPGQRWYVRVAGGGSPETLTVRGVVTSSAVLGTTEFSMESRDVLDTSLPGTVLYEFNVKGTGQDGIDLEVPDGESACFGVDLLPPGMAIEVGAVRRAVSAPFDLATLGACTPPVPTPSACDQPDYDRATEQGVFVWKDCSFSGPGQRWYVRAAGGGSTETLAIQGAVTSTAVLGASKFSMESKDVLDTTVAGSVQFEFNVKGAGQDGIDLEVPDGETACFGVDLLPSGAVIEAGAGRQPMPFYFDLGTLGPCS